MTDPVILRIENVSKAFDGLVALDKVSINVSHGSITALIGPNGAGKTTLFSVISGFVKPDTGSIVYRSDEIHGYAPHKVALKGIGRAFQEPRIFSQMSVLNNVAVAAKGHPGEHFFPLFATPRRVAAFEKENRQKAFAHLEFVGLADKSHLPAGQLSYGQQKLLAIARLLANDADLLLLDEPTAGVHHDMIDSILEVLGKLTSSGKTILLIEHNLNIVLKVSNWVYLMDSGRVAASGSASEVLNDRAIQEAYLGV